MCMPIHAPVIGSTLTNFAKSCCTINIECRQIILSDFQVHEPGTIIYSVTCSTQ